MESQQLSERAIFEHAIELDSAAQAAYLAEACADDPERRAKAEELLNAHREAARFIAEPAFGNPTIFTDTVAERPGHVLGPYKLLEQIGEGGFGVVFMAEQERRQAQPDLLLRRSGSA